MMNYIWGILMAISVVCGIITGNLSKVSNAVLEGGSSGVELCLSLLGMMMFWGGLTAIMEQSGLSEWLGRLLSPFLRWLFPQLHCYPKARNAIAMNVAANMLGLGNGATPLGIKAMKELEKINENPLIASNSMVTFVVLNSVSVQLIPTGLFIIRKQFGSADPTNVLPAVWFASIVSAIIGVGLALLLNQKKGNPYGTYR